MAELYNPSLSEEPRKKRAVIIGLREEESLFRWIEGTDRFTAYDAGEDYSTVEAEELEAIMGTSMTYELDDEDDDLDLED